jgi:type IV secretion system protein VirB4
MFDLREYRRRAAQLADFLPWAALIERGVMLNKDGALQRTARFRGPDLDSATAVELMAAAGRLNNALRRLGSGWAIFVEAQRGPAEAYPLSDFPDPVSALVDEERRAQFEEHGAHFESAYFLTFLFLPPAEKAARMEGWLYEGKQARGVDWREVLAGFLDRTDRVLALLEGFVPEVAWLSDAETLTYLHSTVSTKRHRVGVPDTPMHLDVLLADQPLAGGLEPRLGGSHLRILTLSGFPSSTWPGLLDELNRLAFPYRWSTRALCLDKVDAARVLTRAPRCSPSTLAPRSAPPRWPWAGTSTTSAPRSARGAARPWRCSRWPGSMTRPNAPGPRSGSRACLGARASPSLPS